MCSCDYEHFMDKGLKTFIKTYYNKINKIIKKMLMLVKKS